MRSFRFGVVGTPYGGGARWIEQARHWQDLGFTTLLMPDGTQLLSSFPALALAAGATELRVGTFVAAAPLRTPGQAAWDAHSMTVLTDGRFEFGIGAGRPGTQEQATQLGFGYGTPGERLTRVVDTITALRELDGAGTHTPVLMACGGRRSRELAAEHADIVTFAMDAMTPRERLGELAADVRRRAGDRADDLEFATNVFVVGDDVPDHVVRYLGATREEFLAADTAARVSGTPRAIADELLRRREEFGTSYVTVNAEFAEAFAPALELLTDA